MEDISWEGGGTLPENSYKPSQEKKPNCKGEPDLFSDRWVPLLHTDRKTHILLLLYKDFILK